MALRMSSAVAEASAISPLRMPRDRHWPSPIIFRAPVELVSPTTTHTLEVPTSSPTMMEEASGIFLPVSRGFYGFDRNLWSEAGFEPTSGNIICNRQINPRNNFSSFLAMIVNGAPVAQLPIEIGQTKDNFR